MRARDLIKSLMAVAANARFGIHRPPTVIMGTSVEMIERHYGALLDGSTAGITSRLAEFESLQDRAAEIV